MKPEIALSVLMLSLPVGQPAHAGTPPEYVVTVRIQNDAPVPGWLLRSAEQETSRVFRQMGIDLRWRDDSTIAGDDLTAPEVSIVLMSAEMGAKKSKIEHLPARTLASASQQTGRAYVFCDRVADAARRHGLGESTVLGHAFTHELGHMIASVGHDAHGIMRETLELREAGFFGFTDAQQRAIRSSLAAAIATDAPRLALRVAPEVRR